MSPESSIRSELLLTVIMTRAHVVAIMADERLGAIAKLVGCYLWAVTETWNPGEEKAITVQQVADAIDTGTGPQSERNIRRAIKALEDAEYLEVSRDACVGRGHAPSMRMIRRNYGDVGTMAESGPSRVWTKEQMVDAGGVGEKPYLTVVPPPGEQADEWGVMGTPHGFMALLDDQLAGDATAKKELTARKRREVSGQLAEALEFGSPHEVAFGLGYWLGDRQLANAPILASKVKWAASTYRDTLNSLADESPAGMFTAGFELGSESFQHRVTASG